MRRITRLTPELIAERIERSRRILARTDFTGMTRPARVPGKREALQRLGLSLGPFEEGPEPRPTQLPARRVATDSIRVDRGQATATRYEDRLTWHPPELPEPLVIEIPTVFEGIEGDE